MLLTFLNTGYTFHCFEGIFDKMLNLTYVSDLVNMNYRCKDFMPPIQ